MTRLGIARAWFCSLCLACTPTLMAQADAPTPHAPPTSHVSPSAVTLSVGLAQAGDSWSV